MSKSTSEVSQARVSRLTISSICFLASLLMQVHRVESVITKSAEDASRSAPLEKQSGRLLESKLHGQLELSRITHALPQEAVKVEQRCRTQRVNVVGIVEGIEHLDDRNQRVAFTKLEWTLETPVKLEVLVGFSCGIAVRRRSGSSGDGLGGAGLH